MARVGVGARCFGCADAWNLGFTTRRTEVRSLAPIDRWWLKNYRRSLTAQLHLAPE